MDSFQAKGKFAANEPESNALDPFAADIFADSKTVNDLQSDSSPTTPIEENPVRIWRLPKAARPATDWNWLWRNLPADFSAELPNLLAGALAKCLNLNGENAIEFRFLVERETVETPGENNDSWWARVAIENSEAEFAFEINDGFAGWLVDRMLGEETISESLSTRDLTDSEIAVLEFLAVNLAHEANRIVKAPLFKFRSLARQIPVWTRRKSATDADSLLVSTWQIVHGSQPGFVKLYLAPGALRALQWNENKLLTRAPRRTVMWRDIQNRVKDVRARVFLGAAQITLRDAAGLETGDVVLLDNYGYSVINSELEGSAEIFLGDGEPVKINGAFEPSEVELPEEYEERADVDKSFVRRIASTRALRFFIEYIEELENPHFLEKSMPEENINLSDETELPTGGESGGITLENLAVTLRVELEARRLTLAEVGNLRVNQIIELAARASDPVNLLIDEKVVARGELVEVEERVGVRIVQILR